MAAACPLLYGTRGSREGARGRRRCSPCPRRRSSQAAPIRGSGENAGPQRLSIRNWAMTRRQRRLTLIGGALAILALAAGLVLIALNDSIVFFNSPTDLVEKQVKPGQRVRIGGLVKEGSVLRGDQLAVRFEVTDGTSSVPVAYQGLLPDLFREGQGVVAEGALDATGTFRADSVLAKHDETYMPREVADALKKQGHWKDDYQKKVGGVPQGRAQ